jgi:hypothetical protein
MIAGEAADLALSQAMLDLRATGASMHQWAPFKLVRLGRVSPPLSDRPPSHHVTSGELP